MRIASALKAIHERPIERWEHRDLGGHCWNVSFQLLRALYRLVGPSAAALPK
ncbi:MAG: hypothetical protein WDN29_07500 [Methylovirgula sp.]